MPLLTSKLETITCFCGQKFDTRVFLLEGRKYCKNLCPDCRKRKDAEDLKTQFAKELKEVKESQRRDWFAKVGVPALFTGKTFDSFDSKLQPKAFAAVKGYQGKSLVLYSPGTFGVGKTHLVCALAMHLIKIGQPAVAGHNYQYQIVTRPCPVHFTTEAKMLARIRETYDHRYDDSETERDVYKNLERFDLLILDEVAKVRPKDLSFLQSVYFNIIDSRYVNQMPIILTTNLSPAELEEHIGGACADRLREMAPKENFLLMKGKSYRGTNYEEKK